MPFFFAPLKPELAVESSAKTEVLFEYVTDQLCEDLWDAHLPNLALEVGPKANKYGGFLNPVLKRLLNILLLLWK